MAETEKAFEKYNEVVVARRNVLNTDISTSFNLGVSKIKTGGWWKFYTTDDKTPARQVFKFIRIDSIKDNIIDYFEINIAYLGTSILSISMMQKNQIKIKSLMYLGYSIYESNIAEAEKYISEALSKIGVQVDSTNKQ